MSSKRKIRIGILATLDLKSLEPLMHKAAQNAEFRLVTPGSIDRAIDILIIPDNIGINPNIPGFIVSPNYVGMCFRPICPFAERFRVQELDYYKQNLEAIIGVGDGAAMLWSYLGNKLIAHPKGVELFKAKKNSDIQDLEYEDRFVDYHEEGNLYLVKNINTIGRDSNDTMLNRYILQAIGNIRRQMQEDQEIIEEQPFEGAAAPMPE